MKIKFKRIYLLLMTFSVFFFFACSLNGLGQNKNNDSSMLKTESATNSNESDLIETQKNVDLTASFEIYTNGTKRIFTAAMYHNQSDDVFITANDSSIIYVKKPGINWSDFFKTLPFSLTKECLVTGTKQTFCTSKKGKLSFFLNGEEKPNALDFEINDGDFLKIEYNYY